MYLCILQEEEKRGKTKEKKSEKEKKREIYKCMKKKQQQTLVCCCVGNTHNKYSEAKRKYFASLVSPTFFKRVSNNNPSLIFVVVAVSFMSFRTTLFLFIYYDFMMKRLDHAL